MSLSTSTHNQNQVQSSGSDEGKKILKNLIETVNKCQRKYGGKKELASEKDELILELLDCWENVFDFGLKKSPIGNNFTSITQATSSKSMILNEISDVIKNVQDIFSDFSSYTTAEQVLWNLIRNQLTAHEKDRYDNLKNIWTNSGRIRSWLRSALNEHSLNRYVLMLLSDENLPKIYQSYSLLVDAESTNLLPSIASGLDPILFAITIDSSELNRPRNKRIEPIISAPQPTQPVKKLPSTKIRNISTFDDTEEVVDVVKYLDADEICQKELSSTYRQNQNYFNDLKSSDKIPESYEPCQQNYFDATMSNNTEKEFQRQDSYISDIDSYLKTLKINGISDELIQNENEPLFQQAKEIKLVEETEPSEKNLIKNESECDSDENSSIISKSTSTSSFLNNSMDPEQKCKILENELKIMTEKCSFLEARVAELSLENNRLQRYGNFINNDFGNYGITIPKCNLIISKHSKHYEYEIQINSRENENWMISKRYSAFYKLHREMLRKHNSLVKVIDFPPKRKLGNLNTEFVEERRLRLQTYLRSLLEILPSIILCTSKQELQDTIEFFR